jgi:hypothetical protein
MHFDSGGGTRLHKTSKLFDPMPSGCHPIDANYGSNIKHVFGKQSAILTANSAAL